MELALPELEEIRILLEDIGRRIRGTGGPEWYTLRAACDRKGINYNTARVLRHLQPGGGVPDALLAGRRVWHRATVEQWLQQTDEEVKR